MAKIQILPPQEAQKIAAGEVVERPANIVKELVENALDAGSTHLKLICQDGGKKCIRLVDNGSGMDSQDAKMCFAHHATSKIRSVDDLLDLHTFGFRGEALSSIASVSKVALITKENAAATGTKLVLEGGILQSESDVSATTGTDITIDDLFYNVPARRKFLKARDTEWRHIVQLMHACALSNLSLHVELIHDGMSILNCPAAESLRTRALQIWEKNLADALLELEPVEDKNNIRISGFISNHQYYTYDRSRIFIFANNRWVKNQHISKAILKGYQNVLQPGCYPVACIFITVDPHELDINTHPRKEEVIFLHPKRVEGLITNAVKQALEQNMVRHLAPQKRNDEQGADPVIIPTEHPFAPRESMPVRISEPVFAQFADPEPADAAFNKKMEFAMHRQYEAPAPGVQNSVFNRPVANDFTASRPAAEKSCAFKEAPSLSAVFVPERTYTLIGQYRNTYLVIQQGDDLVFIDQHAAHERILYELFAQRFDEVATIKLMFPTIVTLKADDVTLLEKHIHLLEAYGIKAEIFSAQSVIISESPVTFKQTPLDAVVKQFVQWLHEYVREGESEEIWRHKLHDQMRAHMACVAAVKAGDVLPHEQMHQLIDDLLKTPNKLTCPHGRPTMWVLSTHEIDKKFKRDYRQNQDLE